MKRLRTMPWSRVALGDDPLPTVALLLLVVFLLPSDTVAWIAFVMLLAVAIPLRVWLLCQDFDAPEKG